MEEKRVTKEQLKAALSHDMEELLDRIVDSVNKAQWGHIIDQSEEPVRDAHAEFRRQAYQKALELLADRQKSFSPWPDSSADQMAEQGPAEGQLPDNKRSGGV